MPIKRLCQANCGSPAKQAEKILPTLSSKQFVKYRLIQIFCDQICLAVIFIDTAPEFRWDPETFSMDGFFSTAETSIGGFPFHTPLTEISVGKFRPSAELRPTNSSPSASIFVVAAKEGDAADPRPWKLRSKRVLKSSTFWRKLAER